MSNRLVTCILLALLLVSACNSYDFSINDRVVYTPDPLFKDFNVPDQALRNCIKEAINDLSVTAASGLSALNCSAAGIETLAGLSTFRELEHLTLSSNNIVNISELASLSILQTLYLDNNQIIDPVPLFQLPTLQRVNLAGNPALICPGSGSLLRVAELTLPRHCRQE